MSAPETLYRWRWLLSLATVAVIALTASAGFARLGAFSRQVDSLQDDPPQTSKPKMFDARYDIWFDPEDPGLLLYKQIEDKFSAEDFVLVAFEEPDHPLGVFSHASLSTISELTRRIEAVPYVRHVRSLTSNPWIRWAEIEDGEQGLVITDLFERQPTSYDESEVLRRAIAVLGAPRAAAAFGDERVRAAIGADARYEDLIGEPRLVGNIVSADARTTAIQVQLLRPRIATERLRAAFGEDERAQVVGGSMHGNHAQWQALKEIRQILDEHGADREMHIAGMPSIESNFMETGEQDMAMILWMFVMILVVMTALFRRVVGVLTPVAVIGCSLVGMIGTVLLRGDLLNNITAGAPNMITAVSIADAVHLVASYFALRPRYTDKRALIVEVVRVNAMPVFLTSVTTAIGFYSLTAGNIIPLQMLGYTAGLGALLAYVTSMTLVPALLSLAPLPKRQEAAALDGQLDRDDAGSWAARLTDRVIRRRLPIVVASAAVTALAMFGLLRIELDSDFRTMFPDDNVTMTDMTWIEERLGGSGDLEIVFEAPGRAEGRGVAAQRQLRRNALLARQIAAAGGQSTGLSDEEARELDALSRAEADHQRRRIATNASFLDELRRFTDRLREEMEAPDAALYMISRLDGALDILRKINQVQNEGRAAFYRPPAEADVNPGAREPSFYVDDFTDELDLVPGQDASTLTAQYFLQYENGAKPAENLATLVSIDRRTFRLQGRVRQGRSKLQAAAFARVREIAEAEFPALCGTVDQVERGDALSTMTLSGKSLLYAGMTEKFTFSFIVSMTIALCLIVAVITGIFRSVTIGLVSIIPNVLPIVVPIGMFGLLGLPLDGPAVFVSSVALGVATDDTIHLLTKFTRARRRGLTTRDALRESLHSIGNALTFTTVILILGFGVLVFSEFAPNSMMGKLAAVMIGLAWVADFLVTPAVLALLPDPNAKPDAAATTNA